MSTPLETRSTFLRYYLPVLLWVALISLFSTSGFGAGWTLGILKSLAELLLPSLSEEDLYASNFVLRKLAHVGEYFVLGLLLWRAWRRDQPEAWGRSWALGTLALGVGMAMLDELHQQFEPGRGAELADIGWDSLGVLLALAVVYVGAQRGLRAR
ncbi:MAG: VanZ family protein [Acidobacteria bacterium]|nr:VanZ family protein [Acidobacteriota bacterium]